MNKGTKIVVGLIVIILIIWGVSASNKSKVSETGPIRIGGAFLLTGPIAAVGEVQKNAVVMAVDLINKNGGIKGRPVELVIEDAGYDPKTAVSAYQALKQKGLKLFIIDGSPAVSATHDLVIKDENFTIAGAATAPAYFDGSNRTCRIALTSRNFGPLLADLLIKDGKKIVSMLLPDNEYGRGLAEEFKKTFDLAGGTTVVEEYYSAAAGTSDFRTNISKIKAKQGDIDALVFSNVLSSAEPMLKQLKELGVTKPMVSDNPTLENPALKDYSLVEGIKYINYDYAKGERAGDSEKAKAFKAEYKARYGSDPIYFAAGSFDIANILAKAISEVGEDPTKVAEYVSSLKDYSGVTGTFSFNSDCEVERPSVISTIKNGKVVDINK